MASTKHMEKCSSGKHRMKIKRFVDLGIGVYPNYVKGTML